MELWNLLLEPDLVENEDYEPLDRKSVILTPGTSQYRYFEANIVDDNYFENNEVFYVEMEVPEPFSSKIELLRTKGTVTIRDDDGWFI